MVTDKKKQKGLFLVLSVVGTTLLLRKKSKATSSDSDAPTFGYLSPNFSREDFIRSETALKKGIDNSKYTLQQWENGQMFANYWLEPLLKLLPKGKIEITSWFRTKELNDYLVATIGASKTSDHVQGYAIDIDYFEAGVNRNDLLVNAINTLISQGKKYDQIIFEQGTAQNPNYVHLSWRPYGENRMQKWWNP